MAGRGTDILLGGNPEFLARNKAGVDSGDSYEEALVFFRERCQEERQEVLAAGGLFILGTERHEARRIDNQLRGRAARQGDPGGSRFYLSLEDDLLRIFGGARIQRVMEMLKVPEDEPIEHKWITKAIESAQTRVEGQNFDIRKHLLEYDNVLNQQRMTIYDLRRRVLDGGSTHEMVLDAVDETAYAILSDYCHEEMPPEEWDIAGAEDALAQVFVSRAELQDVERDFETLVEVASSMLREAYEDRVGLVTGSLAQIRQVEGEEEGAAHEHAVNKWHFYEKERYLRELDKQWKQHLLDMDHLREGVNLSAYAQKDPKVIYKKEGFNLFAEMLARIRQRLSEHLYRVEVKDENEIERLRQARRQQRMQFVHGQQPGQAATKTKTIRRKGRKVGRNDPCPCGSGRKYKQCCLPVDQAVGNE